MKYVIVGLGNPGKEYSGSRHNAGRSLVEQFAIKNDFTDWEKDKHAQALYSKGKLGKHSVELLLPETYMNKSGLSVKYAVTKHGIKPERIIVVYDDMDLPLGTLKIAYGRSSGGHRGLESIIKSIKTKDFVRVRIGVSPATPKGKVKKPSGEKKVLDFLMASFRKPEEVVLKKVSKKVNEALMMFVDEGRVATMNKFNQ